MSELVYPEESYRIIGACFEVYNEMGSGFLESVYQECLDFEFGSRDIPFQAQVQLALRYKGRLLKQKYVPDFVCFEKIVVELKAVQQLTREMEAQVHNYLKATGYKLGLLVNFGEYPKLQLRAHR